MQEESDLDPWSLYNYAIKSPLTKEKYQRRICKFFEFIKLKGTLQEQATLFVQTGMEDNKWAFNNILGFLQMQKDRASKKEIAAATVYNYLKAIKLFCEMNDILISWKKITRGLPRGKRYAEDRAPTIEEIQKIIQYPDRRIKPIIFTMCSSGIRLGAWDYLKWGNVKPIEIDGRIVAAKILVYACEEEQYFTFITNEAYQSLREWIEFRKECGESVTKDSWLMRNLWDVTTPTGKGLATIPKKLKSSRVKRVVERALHAQGLRRKLENGIKRHEFQTDHGFRKYFKSKAEQFMKPINVETLMGHSIGISDSYYRPTEREILEDYLRAIQYLTISNNQIAYRTSDAELMIKDDAIASLTDKMQELLTRIEELEAMRRI